MKQAYEDYSLSLEAGRRTNLHIVVRLNVLNALARNAVVMGFAAEGLCHDAFVSPYCQLGPGLWPLSYISSTPSVPSNLQSTDVQRSTPHHPWIDLFPFPRFRDNMIHALSVRSFDEDELCLDMMELDGSLHQLDKKPSVMVWGESWDMRSWEASMV
ncbi:hypothetical protein Sste5346_010216 [Sporothrix stenoceras]|uniref:Uncharacterized protein n=1 Tax=Sporothrix stenoceras TaxID=5173 RepID=A0ABR3YI01_9PEZI